MYHLYVHLCSPLLLKLKDYQLLKRRKMLKKTSIPLRLVGTADAGSCSQHQGPLRPRQARNTVLRDSSTNPHTVMTHTPTPGTSSLQNYELPHTGKNPYTQKHHRRLWSSKRPILEILKTPVHGGQQSQSKSKLFGVQFISIIKTKTTPSALAKNPISPIAILVLKNNAKFTNAFNVLFTTQKYK